MTWLADTPRAVVRAHLRMLPRLEAEEALAAVDRTAVGTGSLKSDASKTLVKRWIDLVRAGAPPKRKTGRQLAASAAASGITVRKVKRDG